MLLKLTQSDRPNKRFQITMKNPETGRNKTVHFGANSGSTFIDHQDSTKRKNYIARHRELNEDWSKQGINTAGFWSRWLLWNKPTLEQTIKFIEKKFNVTIEYI